MDTWLPTQKPSKSLFWTILWVWLDSLIKLRRAHSEKKFRPSPSVLSSLLRSCLLKDSVNPSRFKRWLMSRCLWGSRTQMCAAVPTFACPRPLMLLDRVWWLGKASFYSPKNVQNSLPGPQGPLELQKLKGSRGFSIEFEIRQ